MTTAKEGDADEMAQRYDLRVHHSHESLRRGHLSYSHTDHMALDEKSRPDLTKAKLPSSNLFQSFHQCIDFCCLLPQ